LFSLFELSSSLKWELNNRATIYKGFTENSAIKLNTLDINQEFFNKYFNPKLPYTRAGDTLLLSVAYKDKMPLITEDNDLNKKAKELDLEVFSIDEYINL